MVELVSNPKAVWHYIQQLSNGKVDKIEGKGLSANDYTDEEKQKLADVASGAQVNVIESIDIDGVQLTPDANKNVSIDLSGKVDKIEGKGLSTNDYTNNEKQKLENIESGAQVNIIESIWIDGIEINPDQYKKISIDLSGKLDVSQKGVANGLAELDANGKVPSSQLPSYVDDVKEYDDLAHFPEIGEADKVYVAKDTNKTYRWSGTAYVSIGSDLALGETSSTAYRGDRGKIAYDHAMAKGSAFTTGMYKFQTNAEGHVIGATAVAKSDVVGLGLPGDVQINGTSIVDANGVADIPIAGTTTLGVVKINNTYGIGKTSNNALYIRSAYSSDIKSGSASYLPIAPNLQHESIFYGLSKLAGVDLKNDLEVTVGTYPETSKAAIRSLIGIGFASTTTPGLAMAGGMGISANPNSGEMYISAASAAQIKAGASNYAPIVPSTQDRSVFFGLAKIAGVDLADVELSELAYPANAQSAIQSLIGIGVCGYNQLGLAKVDSTYGISADQNGRLYLVKANSAAIKAGANERLPIAPATQHESIFYGLSKLAGVDLAEDSEVVLGTYPSTSKVAIRSLIDAASTDNPVFTGSISLGRKANTTVGDNSFAVGFNVEASGNYSHAEGNGTKAIYVCSHAEGNGTRASANAAHAEGYYTYAYASCAHAEGNGTTASANAAHAEGAQTVASAQSAHAEGYGTNAVHTYSHAEGYNTLADKPCAHAEGNGTIASGDASHAEGYYTNATGDYSHVGGIYNTIDNLPFLEEWVSGTSYAVGDEVKYNNYHCVCITANEDLAWDGSKWSADSKRTFAEIIGNGTADDARSNARTLDWYGNERLMGDLYVGCNADSTGGVKVAVTVNPVFTGSISLGRRANTTVGTNSFAVGYNVQATQQYSHAEGFNTKATNNSTHAEGVYSTASGYASHAEGEYANAEGEASHAEGLFTKAAGMASHVGGKYNVADNINSWPDWVANTSYAVGDRVKRNASGYECIIANEDSSWTSANWRIVIELTYAEIIGNGTADDARSNARALDWFGNEHLMGDLYVGCNADSTGGVKVAVLDQIAPEYDPTSTYDVDDICAYGRKLYKCNTAITVAEPWDSTHWTPTSLSAEVDMSLYATKADPVFTGSISLGRKANTTVGEYSVALGYSVEASAQYSYAEGAVTRASAYVSHAEGYGTQAINSYSHAEGYSTKTQKACAHAEGNSSIADGECSHVEGYHTKSNGAYSHVGGIFNAIDDLPNLEEWVAGTSYAIGDKVKRNDTSYVCNTANSDSSFNSSKWTIDTKRTYAEIIGNGTASNARSNARTLDWEGNGWYAGNLTAAGGYLTLGSGNNAVTISAAQLQALLNLASATGVSF